MLKNNTDSVKNAFSKYLDTLGLTPKSHKNYRSDLSHFLGWAILKIRTFGSYAETLAEVIPFLSFDMAKEYKSFMVENNQPVASVNRRLSTLRHLARFLVATQVIDADFTKGIENVSLNKPVQTNTFSVMDDFKSFLEAEKVSASTLKNYMSDVRQFLTWLDSNAKNFSSGN